MALKGIAEKVFGTQNERELKRIRPIVQRINDLEAEIEPLSDDQLREKTQEFKDRLKKGETVNDILPEAFACVREAAKRTLGQRHYDVQMIGGITLNKGRIAEMRTGEGKTLVSTLPSYLNALEGKGVHIITVNDYLAKRDAEWMGQVHRFLGLTVGIIVHGMNDRERKEAYQCDITYGTNSEFGFDYLRDNMKFRLEDYVQRDLHYCLIDEVDSILIDEARTPLIISGPTEDSTDLYYEIDRQIRGANLEKDKHYTLDEKSRTAALTEEGVNVMEARLKIENLYDPTHIETLHHVNQGLRAHVLFKPDVDYVVRGGEVIIVDEFTGRMMPGRRWSDGLHQAIEAKENVTIENENQTLATITYQNFFRMYNKLSGMTGTADTEATEFRQIYKLDVTVIPTNRPIARVDEADVIHKAEVGKFKAIAEEIQERNAKGQPVLVGTVSVEKSEAISQHLRAAGIKHHVLNAKQHQREAEIVAQAGRVGSVTIATNMAGRGTDIVLGGNTEFLARHAVGEPDPAWSEEEKAEWDRKHEAALEEWNQRCGGEKEKVLEAGGLFIIGTERHESRRIDNQLRGRSGRQGDPGGSRFYLSLEDDLMRIFGTVNISRFMDDDMPIEHKWITRAIENAQKKVEGHNYDIRKHLLEYDDVMNQQRKVVYAWRKEVLSQDNLREMIFSMVQELADAIAQDFFPRGKLRRTSGEARLDVDELNDAVKVTFQMDSNIEEKDVDPFNDRGLSALIVRMAESAYNEKEATLGKETMRQVERVVLLSTIDQLWKDHLLAMDQMREGIGLQGYGQKDPLIEYKKQGFNYFQQMMGMITGDSVRKAFAVQSAHVQDLQFMEGEAFDDEGMDYNVSDSGEMLAKDGAPSAFSFDEQMKRKMPQQMNLSGGGAPSGGGFAMPGEPEMQGAGGPNMSPSMMGNQEAAQPMVREIPKVGRNDPCPCGSGKKYKKCHGA